MCIDRRYKIYFEVVGRQMAPYVIHDFHGVMEQLRIGGHGMLEFADTNNNYYVIATIIYSTTHCIFPSQLR